MSRKYAADRTSAQAARAAGSGAAAKPASRPEQHRARAAAWPRLQHRSAEVAPPRQRQRGAGGQQSTEASGQERGGTVAGVRAQLRASRPNGDAQRSQPTPPRPRRPSMRSSSASEQHADGAPRRRCAGPARPGRRARRSRRRTPRRGPVPAPCRTAPGRRRAAGDQPERDADADEEVGRDEHGEVPQRELPRAGARPASRRSQRPASSSPRVIRVAASSDQAASRTASDGADAPHGEPAGVVERHGLAEQRADRRVRRPAPRAAASRAPAGRRRDRSRACTARRPRRSALREELRRRGRRRRTWRAARRATTAVPAAAVLTAAPARSSRGRSPRAGLADRQRAARSPAATAPQRRDRVRRSG